MSHFRGGDENPRVFLLFHMLRDIHVFEGMFCCWFHILGGKVVTLVYIHLLCTYLHIFIHISPLEGPFGVSSQFLRKILHIWKRFSPLWFISHHTRHFYISHIVSCPLDLRMLEPCIGAPCLLCSVTWSTSSWLASIILYQDQNNSHNT